MSEIYDPRIDEIAARPIDLDINFSRIPSITFVAHEIVRSTLSGQISPDHNFNRANIVQSAIVKASARGARFSGSDIKDSAIRDSRFAECEFRGTHINTSTVVDASFSDCQFTSSNFNRSEFYSCEFQGVDFSNLLIKSCRFEDCRFERCATTNKLFEDCLLLGCEFAETELQIQTLLENFGLGSGSILPSNIRTSSPREGFSMLDELHVRELLEDPSLTKLESFRVAYYLHGLCDLSYDFLDECLDIPEWLRRCAVPGTFLRLLETFSGFLDHLLASGQSIVHPLLKFHDLTFWLSEGLRTSNRPESTEIFRAVMGIHMENSRRVEHFLQTLATMAESHQGEVVTFLAEGPLELDWYEERLPFVGDSSGIQIQGTRPHNSPIELLVEYVTNQELLVVLAFFLASRTQFELVKLKEPAPVALAEPGTRPQLQDGRTQSEAGAQAARSLLSLYCGRKQEDREALELRVRAVLPGTLLADLRLDMSLGLLYKGRKILVGLLRVNRDD